MTALRHYCGLYSDQRACCILAKHVIHNSAQTWSFKVRRRHGCVDIVFFVLGAEWPYPWPSNFSPEDHSVCVLSGFQHGTEPLEKGQFSLQDQIQLVESSNSRILVEMGTLGLRNVTPSQPIHRIHSTYDQFHRGSCLEKECALGSPDTL